MNRKVTNKKTHTTDANRKEKNTMKKLITLIIAMLLTTTITVGATEIPQYSVPIIANDESVEIVENIMGDILSEVKNGLGFGLAQAQANTRIRKAVLDGKTNGYSFTVLSVTAANAMRQARDMYLRPQFYAENETKLRELLSDLILEVENGTKDYITAKNEAYIRIYKDVNPDFNPEEQYSLDICYQDIPPVADAMFTIARKILTEAIK